jgi:hypothetical protein
MNGPTSMPSKGTVATAMQQLTTQGAQRGRAGRSLAWTYYFMAITRPLAAISGPPPDP